MSPPTPLPAQNQIHVRVLSADRQKMELELLCPMVHEVVLRAQAPENDTFVRLREGEYYRARLEPGEVGTTRRNRVVVETGGYIETLRLLGVNLR